AKPFEELRERQMQTLLQMTVVGVTQRPFEERLRLAPQALVLAELLIALDRPREARDIVEAALAEHWDPRLLRRYADCAGGDALPLIQKA
ncbi:hypothetical protein ACOIC6_27960, partial [Klebsiella pneumoniae]|uniref:hypothetical protein n=1 Tax=Klebsiella pneumoniae TaxID=573 RepID=UPI003B5CA042